MVLFYPLFISGAAPSCGLLDMPAFFLFLSTTLLPVTGLVIIGKQERRGPCWGKAWTMCPGRHSVDCSPSHRRHRLAPSFGRLRSSLPFLFCRFRVLFMGRLVPFPTFLSRKCIVTPLSHLIFNSSACLCHFCFDFQHLFVFGSPRFTVGVMELVCFYHFFFFVYG